MNISQWIDDLEQANQPSESPAFINQHRATRKHGQGSGKGSLLEPFVDRVRHTRRTHPPESPRASNSATSSVTRPSSSSPSSSSSSTPSSSSSKRYQRKPRHHTKADKYHPKRKRRSHSKEKAKKQSKKKEKNAKRPHRRKHNSEVITGVVQSFHAKDVPKNRLTVISVLLVIPKSIAEDRIYSSSLAARLVCIQKVAHRVLPGAKAVSYVPIMFRFVQCLFK
jgi:hypothetical protein